MGYPTHKAPSTSVIDRHEYKKVQMAATMFAQQPSAHGFHAAAPASHHQGFMFGEGSQGGFGQGSQRPPLYRFPTQEPVGARPDKKRGRELRDSFDMLSLGATEEERQNKKTCLWEAAPARVVRVVHRNKRPSASIDPQVSPSKRTK